MSVRAGAVSGFAAIAALVAGAWAGAGAEADTGAGGGT
jgi:hypothetical protein